MSLLYAARHRYLFVSTMKPAGGQTQLEARREGIRRPAPFRTSVEEIG
jgi:hypothetical protein